MNDETRRRLYDALAALNHIAGFVEGQTFSGYQSSVMLRSAVERQFEIVGEALNYASRSDAALVERIAGLRDIVGLRNRIIHGYDRIDDQLIWDIVHDQAPALGITLRSMLDAGAGDEDDADTRI